MTTSPPGEAGSEGTLSCLTGAIVLREGARAVGSTFARDSSDTGAVPPLSTATPSSLRALPVLPTPSAVAALATVAVGRAAPPRRAHRQPGRRSRTRTTSLPWGLVGAFALGATLAALAGLGLDRGALEVAALASSVAGGITLAAALQPPSKRRAVRREL